MKEVARDVWEWLAARPPRVLLLAGWVVFALGCYPGYLSFDSAIQMAEVRSGTFTDAHPAVMTQLWRWLEYVAAGPLPMLALQSGLALFGLAALLRHALTPRAAAVGAVALVLFPPVFAPLAVIWPESLAAGALLAGAAAALVPDRRSRIASGVAWFVACACRPEAALAIVPLVSLALVERVPSRWKRLGVAVGVSAALAGGARLADGLLVDHETYAWDQQLMVTDVVGTLRRAHIADVAELAGLPVVDVEHAADRLAAAHDAYDWWPLAHGEGRLVEPIVTSDEEAALHSAWWHTLGAHPGAYLIHRANLMKQAIGLGRGWQPIYAGFGDQTVLAGLHHRATASDWERGMQAFVDAVGATPLFRPWLYLVLALGAAWLVRRQRVPMALLASGVLYELGACFLAPSAEYRTSHWFVTATCFAIAAWAIAKRASWRKA